MKVSLDFKNVKDTDLVMKFKGIGVNMKRNIKLFPKTPVDLDEFVGLVDEYDRYIIVAADGSKKAISQRNKLRHQTSRMATHLGNYVGDVADDDIQIVYAAGYEPAYKYRLLPKLPPKTAIAKVVRGPNSGTALAYIIPIPRSNGKTSYYELRFAAKNGADTGEFTVIPTTVARFPITIKNLTPGTTYIFQVRAANKVGFNDWSDPIPYMAT
jgi:hypothetical protein